jgi:Trp operon repressor
MTHISKNKIPVETNDLIRKQFLNIFVAQTTKKEVGKLVEEMFSETETIMLAKRISIIVMLSYNCSSYEISKTLKVSPSTVLRLSAMRQSGKFSHIEKILARKKYRESLLGIIETILNAGMPPRGRGRWSRTLREIDAWREGG